MDVFEEKNISPMLLKENTEPFDSPDYIYELKLDGIRCIAYLGGGKTELRNKRNKSVSAIYPELSSMWKCAKKSCILDGELIALKDGKPDFYGVQKRSVMTDAFRITLAARCSPLQFVCYDILYLNGKALTGLPLMMRKELLSSNVVEGHGLGISRYIEGEGTAFFALTKQQGLEGIVAKKKDSLYHVGKRTSAWIKIKVMQDEDLFVCGYQPNENGEVKDLVLGYFDDKSQLCLRGKVYLGISDADKTIIRKYAKNNAVNTPWFDRYKNVVWLKPELIGTAHFMHETESGGMRQPVWKGLRTD